MCIRDSRVGTIPATGRDQKVKVKVTYADDSFDEVEVTLNYETAADKYEPEVEKEIVKPGGTVDLTDNVTNLDELPTGTDVYKRQIYNDRIWFRFIFIGICFFRLIRSCFFGTYRNCLLYTSGHSMPGAVSFSRTEHRAIWAANSPPAG